jgi:hypothetical protein
LGNVKEGLTMATKISLEIVNFKQELARVEREVEQLANKDIKSKVNFAVDTLKVVTPVDTGEARAGWENKTYMAPDGYLDGTILNDVDHIVELNKGSSKQAPKYFIEQVLVKVGVLTP